MAMSKEVGGGAARGVGMSIGGGHVKVVKQSTPGYRATKNWYENEKVVDAKSGQAAKENAKRIEAENKKARTTGGILCHIHFPNFHPLNFPKYFHLH